jgi:hypothetical protein
LGLLAFEDVSSSPQTIHATSSTVSWPKASDNRQPRK